MPDHTAIPAHSSRIYKPETALQNQTIRAHFDQAAADWDSLQDNAGLQTLIRQWLDEAAFRTDATVLDIGCGTGASTGALLSYLSSRGRVVALDLSAQMLLCATEKHTDERCTFLQGAVQRLPLAAACVDCALAFSAWPHFENGEQVMMEIWRVLKPGGCLHIWHHDSRPRVNEIHLRIGGIVADHLFPSPETLLSICQSTGFELQELVDNHECFRLSAAAPA